MLSPNLNEKKKLKAKTFYFLLKLLYPPNIFYFAIFIPNIFFCCTM